MPEKTISSFTEITVTNQPISPEVLPFITGKTSKKKLGKKDISRIELFEKGLATEIKKTDTIKMAVTKIVRMALACEFGATLTRSRGAEHMIDTIVAGILSDQELRKQVLAIIDRFAHE
ncbi:MAG TPA: hypothetical protein VMD02_02710 [Candidatus Omnitrophota bacterium]|nr:hypothetical protein [Candidatus Omnitrophota bacterium]